jgi:hypothetical protein
MYKQYRINNYVNSSHAFTHSPHVIHTTFRFARGTGIHRSPHHDRYANKYQSVMPKNGQYLQMQLLSRLVLQQCTMHGQLYVRFLVACRRFTYCSTKSFCGYYIWVILPSLINFSSYRTRQTYCVI